MPVTIWATAQKEDLELAAVLQWLEAKKKTDLRTLLGEHTSSEEDQIIWRNHQNFMVLQGTLYLHSMPKGENEDLLLFMVPKMHQTAALNGCHQDVEHQGRDYTLSLLQEHFWWPGMAKQMRQVIRACRCCLQCYVRQCSLVINIVIDFFICLGFHMCYISLYGVLSLHNCSFSGS